MTAISYPPAIVNHYLAEKVVELLQDQFTIPANGTVDNYFGNAMRFFPTSPTNIDELTEQFPEAGLNPFAVYDRMFKYRRSVFPHIKSEQLLYYFYKTSSTPTLLFETTQAVYDLLDREDESAQDLNDWIRSKIDLDGTITFSGTKFKPVYFHNLKVYQLEETRDIIDFGTARTWAGNKIIIDYQYHNIDPLYEQQ